MGAEQPEWLPAGWKIRVKVRSCGKKDKYYVNPSNGLKLSSKPQVLRYLKSSGKDRKPKELDKVTHLRNIDISNTVAKQLPPGWIKEIRTRKKGKKTRRDAYYIDPVSGRHFRSMQEVYRYIKSLDSGEATSKLDDNGHVTLELGDHSKSSTGEAKGQRSIGKKADNTRSQRVKSGVTRANGLKGAAMKSAKSDQRSKSGSKVAGLTKVDMQREKEDNFVAGILPNKSPRLDATEEVNDGRRRSMRLVGSKQKNKVTKDQSSRNGSGGSKKNAPNLLESSDLERREKEKNLTGGGQQHKNLANKKKRKTPDRKSTSDLPGRISKRRVQLEIEHPSVEIKTSNKSGVSATMSDDSEVTTTKNAVKDGPAEEPLIVDTNGKISNDSNKNQANNLEQHISLAGQKKRKSPISTCTRDLSDRASKRLAQLDIKHQSMELKTSNKSGVSATLSEESEVTTTKNLVKDGLSDEPLIDDTNGKTSNISNENPANKEQHKPIVLYRRRKKLNSKNTSDLPGTTSKILSQAEIEHPSLEIKTSIKSGVTATKSDESEVTTTQNIVKDGPLDEPLIDDTNGNISNGSKENPASNQEKTTTHDCKEDGKETKKLDSPLEDLLMDPCIEFAFKTLTGAFPVEEGNKVGDSPVSSQLPSGHIWADPCFEFAVKMLTGEMPTADNARFHTSFQQPHGSSLDNVNPLSYSFSQTDVSPKPSVSQEGAKDPSYPHAASGSSHNSVGTSRD